MAEFEKEHVPIKIYVKFLVIIKCRIVNHHCIIERMHKNDQLNSFNKKYELKQFVLLKLSFFTIHTHPSRSPRRFQPEIKSPGKEQVQSKYNRGYK